MSFVQKNFSDAGASYHRHSSVQKQMALELYDVFKGQFIPGRVMEYGVGTGHLSCLLAQDVDCLELDFVDFSLSMLFQCQMNVNQIGTQARTNFIEANIEKHNLPTCASAYISNATVQWLNDFKGFLQKSYDKLDPNSIMAFSAFGEEHFFEFYQSASKALGYQPLDKTQVQFYSAESIHKLAHEAGFEIITLESKKTSESFENLREILKHIKAMGARDDASAFSLTPSIFKNWQEQYKNAYQEQSSLQETPVLPLTWHYHLVILKKPV